VLPNVLSFRDAYLPHWDIKTSSHQVEGTKEEGRAGTALPSFPIPINCVNRDLMRFHGINIFSYKLVYRVPQVMEPAHPDVNRLIIEKSLQ
jgi:hypothetical protein